MTICHSRTRDLAEECPRADVLVVAAGIPGIVSADAVKQGATVIDVGIHRGETDCEGTSIRCRRRRCGRDYPVPGGVGSMTIAMLLRNTLTAALAQQESRQ